MKRHAKTPTPEPPRNAIFHSGMRIRETKYGTFQADVITGEGATRKRNRKQFDTVEEARNFIDNELKEREKLGRLYDANSNERLVDAERAWKHIAGAGLDVSLLEAATFYAKHHAPEAGGWTVDNCFDHYMKELENPVEGSPARPRTIADKRDRLATFIDLYGESPIERITETDVMDWLEGTGADGRHLRNFKTQIQSLFNYAEREAPGGYRNEVAKFPQRKSKEVDPAPTLAPKQAAAVMRELEGIDPKSTATMALCFFAGLRSDEVAAIGGKPGLDWADIDLDAKSITVPAAVAKTGKVRTVDITDNLGAWLRRYEQDSGKVGWSYAYFRKHREMACVAAGVDWGNNLARHSFATYYARLHGKHAAAEALGHRGSVAMVEDHYMGKTVRKDVAARYFKIMPKQASKTIPFKREASA